MSTTPVTPTVITRMLDANHDPVWGAGISNFITDINAVAQMIQTTLLLFQGEWWGNLTQGLPLFQQILGVAGAGKNAEATALLIKQQIENVPYVQSVFNIQTSYSTSRVFTFNCTVTTQFGNLAVTFTPGNSAVLPT